MQLMIKFWYGIQKFKTVIKSNHNQFNTWSARRGRGSSPEPVPPKPPDPHPSSSFSTLFGLRSRCHASSKWASAGVSVVGSLELVIGNVVVVVTNCVVLKFSNN